MENLYTAKQKIRPRSRFVLSKLTFMLLVMILINGKMFGQATNPAISTLPYSFTTYSGTSFPASLSVGLATSSSLVTTDFTSNAPNGTSAGQWTGEVANGISYMGSSSNISGCFKVRMNTTGLTNISVAWTNRRISNGSFASSYMELQWRSGNSGAWNNVSNDQYDSDNASTSFGLILPVGAENLADLQLRWVLYDQTFLFGSRDRVSVDDIFICSAPNVTAGNNGPVCAGVSLNLSSTPNGMTSYQWSGPNSFASSNQNPVLANSTAAMSGTYTVTVTNSVGCSNTATTTATVNAPSASASSNSPVCSGNSVNLSTPSVSGASYQWSGPNSFSSTSRTPSVSNATAANAGTYTVTVTVGACTATSSTSVTVNTTPTVTASNNGPICAGATLNLTATSSGGTFAWSGPSSYSSTTQNPSRANATGAMSGTYTVTVTSSGCTATSTTNATVNAPSATASSNSPVCSGNAINLTTPSVSSASYQWSGPNGFSSTSRTPSISSATSVNSGTYTVTVTVGGCTATSSASVTVNTTPTISASSNSPVCVGSALNLTGTSSGGTYAWSGPNSFTSTTQNPSISNVSLAAAGTYTVTVTSSGCTATSTTSVTINNAPTGTPTTSPTLVCAGANVNLSANMFLNNAYTASPNVAIPDGNSTGVNSTVSIPAQVISSASRLKISITVGSGHTYVGDVIAKLTSPCGNTTIFDRPGVPAAQYGNDQDFTGTYVFDINAATILPETNSGPSVIPPGSYKPSVTNGTANTNWSGITFPCSAAGNWVLNMSDRVSGDDGNLVSWSVIISTNAGVTYSWTSNPSGFTSTSENTTAQPTQPTVYTVAATGAGCTNNQSVSVSVNPAPDPIASSNAPICVGNDINFSADNIASGQASGNTYSWKRPNNTVLSTQQNPTISNGTAANNGNYTVTITNQFLCTASTVVAVAVNPNPVLNVVSVQNESCPGANDGILTVSASNGTPTYTYTDFVNFNYDGVFSNLSPGPFTAYVSDDNGCNGSVTATINSPNSPPSLTCGGPLNRNTGAGLCTANISNTMLMSRVSSVTGTPAPTVTFSPAAGSFPVGTTAVTATATNSCGVASCTFNVVVTDNQNPVISCPATANISVDAGQCTSSASIGTATATDNCLVASITYLPAGPYAVGTTTVTWTATDNHGNTSTCTQTVNVTDNQNPFITCPAAVNLTADAGQCTSSASIGTATATDNCSVATIVASPAGPYAVGSTTVTWTATDVNGNVATCTQIVNVTENELPVITCPATANIVADGGLCTSSSSIGNATATDNCSVASVVASPAGPYTVGTHTITWTATDVNGNVATCTQTVNVTDNENPIINCPATANISLDAGQCTSSVSIGTATATDNCSVASVTHLPVGPYSVGTHTITWTATDIHGNISTCTQTVNVTDSENPVISCPANVNLTVDAGQCTSSASIGTATATDNCSVASVVASQAGPYAVGTHTITWTATDVNGNISTCTQVVTVADNENPVINCPATANINTDAGQCSSSASIGTATATDNCSIASVVASPAGPYSVGSHTITWTATDASGNTATCNQIVNVADNENPVINCPATANIGTDAGQCTSTASIGTATATDNCSVASLVASPVGPYAIGTYTITWTATDVNGNISTCTQTVNVTDNENPVISSCPANITVSNDLGTCGAVVNFTAPTATDNCTLSSFAGNHNSGETFPIGTTTVTYTATDASGNVSTCSFTITVNGTGPSAPTTISSNADFNNICLGSSIQLTANGGSLGNMNGNYKWYKTTCGGVLVGSGATITVSPTANTTYFARVEDGCGNITSCTAIAVTVSSSPVSTSVSVPFTGMPSNICNGSVVTLSIPSVNKATQYIWDAPAGSYFNGNPLNVSPFATTTPSVSITYGNPSGSLYSTGVQASNACGSSLRKVQKTRGIISVPAYISGPSTSCQNSSISYSTPDVDAASSYQWTITGDATLSATNNMVTVNFGPAWNGGTLCVAAQTSCYTSPTKCLAISRSAAPLSNLSGNFTACPNANQTYSVNASAGAASYNWSLPSGAFGSSSTNSINAHFNSSYNSVGSICVSVTSICGVTSAPKCKTVAPGLPAMPSSVSGHLNGLCGQTVVYQCPTQSGTTFNWSAPSGAIINSGQGTNAVSVTYSTLSTSPLCVTASNSCGSSNSRCVTAKGAPNSPTSLTATPGSWCANTQGVEFTANLANTTGSYTLNWLYPSAPVANYVFGGGNSSSLILDWGTGNGNVVVVASNACGSGSKAFNVNITCREGESVTPQNMFSVYPNPASTFVNVQFNSTDNSNYQLQLTDLSGRLILDKTVAAQAGLNTQQMDLKQMAKGVYMLVLNGNDKTQKQKIVIE